MGLGGDAVFAHPRAKPGALGYFCCFCNFPLEVLGGEGCRCGGLEVTAFGFAFCKVRRARRRGTQVLGDFPGVAAEHLGAGGAMAISVVPKSSAKHGDGV